MLAVYAVVTGLGLVLLVAGYAVVANEVTYDDQEPGLALAASGTAVAMLAGAFLLFAGRRVVVRRRVAVLGLVPVAAEAVVVSLGAVSTSLVAGEGLTKYHRSDCPLAAGRDWPEADAAQHAQAGLAPCGVCRP
ncbi:MAG: hypothetical protein ACT4QF_06410 [Sporichthyaceae bacterium]